MNEESIKAKDEDVEMKEENVKTNDEKVKMRQNLGLVGGVVIILGIIFGSGIFISPREVLLKTGSVWGSLTVWVGCGVLTTFGALTYAELGCLLPQSGGDYHYINQAYGPLFAFLYLWDANFVFIPSTNAIMGMTFANNILIPIRPHCMIDPVPQKLLAALIISLVYFVNAYNIKFTTRVQNVIMMTLIISLVVIIAGGLVWMSQGRLEHFEDGWEGTKTSVSDWSVACFSGFFAYSGWSYLNFMIEELKNPFVNLPRAIYISLPLCTAIYMLTNISYLAVLGRDGVLATEAIAVDFATAILGWVKWVMPALVVIATAGGLSVHVMASSRMCFAGARNGHMPELLAHINYKCMSPLPTLVFHMLLSMLMLIPDNLTTLITFCSVIESVFTMISCSAVLWLRYKKPELKRPIKVQLWMPITYVVVTCILLVVPVVSEPVPVTAGVVITILGLPVYYKFVKTTPDCVKKYSVKFTLICQKLFLSAVEDKIE